MSSHSFHRRLALAARASHNKEIPGLGQVAVDGGIHPATGEEVVEYHLSSRSGAPAWYGTEDLGIAQRDGVGALDPRDAHVDIFSTRFSQGASQAVGWMAKAFDFETLTELEIGREGLVTSEKFYTEVWPEDHLRPFEDLWWNIGDEPPIYRDKSMLVRHVIRRSAMGEHISWGDRNAMSLKDLGRLTQWMAYHNQRFVEARLADYITDTNPGRVYDAPNIEGVSPWAAGGTMRTDVRRLGSQIAKANGSRLAHMHLMLDADAYDEAVQNTEFQEWSVGQNGGVILSTAQVASAAARNEGLDNQDLQISLLKNFVGVRRLSLLDTTSVGGGVLWQQRGNAIYQLDQSAQGGATPFISPDGPKVHARVFQTPATANGGLVVAADHRDWTARSDRRLQVLEWGLAIINPEMAGIQTGMLTP